MKLVEVGSVNLGLQKNTSLCQKLPSQLEIKISSFYSECARFLKIGKYPFPMISNMDETPVFFDMMPEKSVVQKGQKSVTTGTSGSEKRHVTVVLTVAAEGFIIIFRGKTNQTIKDIEAFEGFVIVTQEKTWIDESLMFIWFDQVWKSYAEKKQKELDFNRSLMVYDAFKAHKTDEMKAVLSINSTDLIMVPPGCTSKCHPLDVCIYKHFKGVLRNCWEDYVADIVTNLSEEEQNSEKFKLPSPSRQTIVNWVAEGFFFLLTEPSRNDRSLFL